MMRCWLLHPRGIWRGGGLWCSRRALLRDRAGNRIQSLLQHGDAGVEPVAVRIERLDRGRKPSRLVLAFLGEHLDLLRLPRHLSGGTLVASPPERGLVGEDRESDG